MNYINSSQNIASKKCNVDTESADQRDGYIPQVFKKMTSNIHHHITAPWMMTMRDVHSVRQLRAKMQFGGYPFHRIQLNQIGDGVITAAAGALLIAAAGVNPVMAGVFGWGVRVSELAVASLWNQRMASDRREARISASQSIVGQQQHSPGQSKIKACREILSSTKYDALGALAAIAASTLLLTGGPLVGVILLGGVIALSQTMSKFKEMAWSSLRYVVNDSEQIRAEQVDLQEPMSAYEMIITVGILTASYAVSFGVLATLFTYAAPAALPVAIGLSVAGAGLMIFSKLGFNKELDEGLAEHEKFLDKKIVELEAEYLSLVQQEQSMSSRANESDRNDLDELLRHQHTTTDYLHI